MDSRLQDAIGAARAGELRAAQQLLTDVLKDDPEQEQAWFLLSHLVEAPQKQQAYLGKVLSINPTHEQARQRLALLRSGQAGGATEDAAAISVAKVAKPDLDVVVQAEGDTLPDWMAEDAELVQGETAVSTVAPAAVAEDLPEWLQESVSPGFLGTDPEPAAQRKAHPQPTLPVQQGKPKSSLPASSQVELRRWNLILITLSILALIILVLLINAFLSL